MDNFVNEKDYELLDQDKYTFFVLRRIIDGDCELLLSDHERLIICFTAFPFPVWIWTPEDASEEELERAYLLARENGLLDGKHRFNLKYEPAEYFLKRAVKDGINFVISTNMYAYDCPEPIEPEEKADGYLYKCSEIDIDDLMDFMEMFHEEIGIDKQDRESYYNAAVEDIKSGKMYFWKNNEGENTASCKYVPTEQMASINLVYTIPEYRRKHYAQNLVYQVTMKVKEEGLTPKLYTDADYTASNACYEKIGYILRGKLCTISPE